LAFSGGRNPRPASEQPTDLVHSQQREQRAKNQTHTPEPNAARRWGTCRGRNANHRPWLRVAARHSSRAIKKGTGKRGTPDHVSTVKGVNFDTTTNKWLVRHMQDGKQKYFGRYATMAEAEQIASNNKAKLAAGEAVGGLKAVESVAVAPQPVAVPMPPVALATEPTERRSSPRGRGA